MKYTFCVTQQCTLRCQYCYVGKKDAIMPLSIAEKIIDFMFQYTPGEDKIEVGFFGGEPLLEFGLIKEITHAIEDHASYSDRHVELAVVTNGTIYSEEIADFLNEHKITFCLSCDGPPLVQDMFRCFPNGRGSSDMVEQTLTRASESFNCVLVNAVYHPRTFEYLPQVVNYFSTHGLRQIYLNADYTAPWTERDARMLPQVYRQVADLYVDYRLAGNSHFISLIDGKIALILRGGYKPLERCRMGKGEFAFTPSGNIYPCERLIGSDSGGEHCIGNINEGLKIDRMMCKIAPSQELNTECLSCSLRDYCMNWCGCTNYFISGYYNRVGPFLCASERAAINVAFDVYQRLEKELGPTFMDHLCGRPEMSAIERGEGRTNRSLPS